MPNSNTTTHPLLEVLQGRNPTWADRARRVIREAHRVLEYTLSTFPGGTDHTPRHTMTVEAIGRMLLPDPFLAALTDEELFFLVTACHYHDLAMAGTEADDDSTESREQVRRDHAIRIGDKIREKWAELGFEDERTAQVLGEVCRGHRPKKNQDGEATWDELNAVEVLGPGTHVRVRLVSALIYAADELHLGADRAPARVQKWRENRDEESRRHWRRHQSTHGPTTPGDGTLLFQVEGDTPGFEENLRTQVFRKALSALRDLGRQAQADGIAVPLPAVHVQWKREKTWLLLLPVVCSDQRPRSRGEIEEAILAFLAREVYSRTDLAALCVEVGSGESDLRAAASRYVGDAMTYRHLVPVTDTPGGFVLSAEESVADLFFGRMREADELDRLYLGRYCASWEERLFDSPYGRSYVASCVLPAVDRSYSVQLANKRRDDPIRVVLERCPTAARLVREFRPPPTNLVKELLLRQATIAGAMFDLHADPNRILDRELRAAVHELTSTDPITLSAVRLIEELALVGGFTPEQLTAAHELSDAARAVLERDAGVAPAGIQVTINQSVPVGAPATASQLPNLLLASQRADTPIMLAPAPGHSLDIRVSSDGTVPLPSEQPVMFGVGPGQSEVRGPGYLPARIEISRPTRTIRFHLGRFNRPAQAQYPTVVRVPPPPQGGRTSVNFSVVIQWPCLTVRDIRSLDAAGQMLRAGGATIELLLEEGGALLASMKSNTPAELFRLGDWNQDRTRGLRGLDGSLPAPLLVPADDIAAAGRMSASERNAWWQSLRQRGAQDRPEPCSLYLRIANASGNTIEEMFLRFLPRNPFDAPRIGPGGTFTQEELDRQWNDGEMEFKMTAYFEPDVFEMARLLREWSQNLRLPFPFNFHFGPDSAPSPLTRSALTVHFPRALDRVWHRERPVIFEFRPVNRDEAYELEANYWRATGQEARAILAEEIRTRVSSPVGNSAIRPSTRPG